MNGRTLLQWATEKLGSEKRLEAELLLCHVLNTNRALLLAHDADELSSEQVDAFQQMVQQRMQDVPLQYLLGTVDFMGLTLQVGPAVLIPRFDTERLVEQALKLLEELEQPTVLDVCTGSGAIALAISHCKPQATVWAGDLSAEALAIAAQNNEQCNTHVQFRQGDLLTPFSHLEGKLDLLTANPPYITTSEINELPGDVLQEPRLALWGGNDGLYFYRKLSAAAPKMLCSGGWIVLEVGYQQGKAVQQLLLDAGLVQVDILQDWQGLDRVVYGRKP